MSTGNQLLQQGAEIRVRRERLRELAAPWYSFRFPNPYLVSSAQLAVSSVLFLVPVALRLPVAVGLLASWAMTAFWFVWRREQLWRALIRDESPELAQKLAEERG